MSSVKDAKNQYVIDAVPASEGKFTEGMETAQAASETVPVEFKARISLLVDRYGGTRAFARRVGVSEAVVRKWKSGISDPSRGNTVAIADAYGVSLEWLAAGRGPMFLRDGDIAPAPGAAAWDEFDLVPLYEAVASAGPGTVGNGEGVVAQMAFRRQWLQRVGLYPKNLAMIHAHGDSMWPTIADGDVLLMDVTINTPDGGIYVVRIGEELRAKRLQRLIDGSVRVSSDNKIYADEVIDASDLWQLSVLGRVIWVGGLI